MAKFTDTVLEEFRAPMKLKIALLWTSLMFLYIYNDYFSLYVPGTITNMASGRMGGLGEAKASILVVVSLILAAPALMIFLSAALPSRVSQWLNILLGIAYTVIEALTLRRSEPFYQVIVALEIGLTSLIVFYAWRWPTTSHLAV